MTFHIIYTANSVKYLLHFIWSLLEHTTHDYCLVSNACSHAERLQLLNAAQRSHRLSYYSIPTRKIQMHGIVLNHLQSRCKEEFFCFMDSDIFATDSGPNYAVLLMNDTQRAAVFSCMPLWVQRSEYCFHRHFSSMVGTYNQLEDGSSIGNSYFAIYRQDYLTQIMHHYTIGFGEATEEDLSPYVKRILGTNGFGQDFYDTGKVINLLMRHHEMLLVNVESPQLHHLGGTSYETTYQKDRRKRHFIKRIASSMLDHKSLNWIRQMRRNRVFNNRFGHMSEAEYQVNYNQRVLHRNTTREHFLELFLALFYEKPLPLVPLFKSPEITKNVSCAHDAYIEMYHKYCNNNMEKYQGQQGWM